jgi:hypothetical protein
MGLIEGISCESSALYLRPINGGIRDACTTLSHSIVFSIDVAEMA